MKFRKDVLERITQDPGCSTGERLMAGTILDYQSASEKKCGPKKKNKKSKKK